MTRKVWCVTRKVRSEAAFEVKAFEVKAFEVKAFETKQRRWINVCVVATIAVVALCFAWAAWARFSTFHNRTFDLAFYGRLAWGIMHADGWEPIVGANVLGLHLSPVLVPIAVAGWLAGYVPVLLVTQALCLAATAWPLGRMGARRFGAAGAVFGAVAFWLYPNVFHVASYEFHPGTIAVLPLAWALDGADRGDAKTLFWSSLGVLACREDLALMTALLGLLARFDSRTRRAGGVIALISLAHLALFAAVLHPIFAPPRGSMQLHFGKWGNSSSEVILHWLTHPWSVIEHLSETKRLLYLPKVLGPLALLSLGSPRWLVVALPVFGVSLMSDFPTTTDLDCHYLTPALPPILLSAIDGTARLSKWIDQWLAPLKTAGRWVGIGLPSVSVVAAHVVAGGTPIARDYDRAQFVPDDRSVHARAAVDAVSPGASVQAPDCLLPHLVERQFLHRAPPPEQLADFVVLDTSHRLRFPNQESVLRTFEEPNLRNWLARDDHRVVLYSDNFVVLERGREPRTGTGAKYILSKPHHGAQRDGPPARLTECLSLRSGRRKGAQVTLELEAHGPCAPDLAIRIGQEQPTNEYRPGAVVLPFGGELSPKHLRSGDVVQSSHKIDRLSRARRIWVGVLRESGARPDPNDPVGVPLDLAVD